MLRHSPRDDMTYSVIMAIGTLYGRGIYKMITVPGIHLAPSQNRLAEIMSSARRRGAGRRRLPQGRRVAGRRAAGSQGAGPQSLSIKTGRRATNRAAGVSKTRCGAAEIPPCANEGP